MNYSNIDIKSYLEKCNIKPSTHRIAIMRYLMENKTHPSADTIYRALVQDYPTMSRTTVYNTLWLFAEQNAITSLDIDRNNTHFDYANKPHAHFICRQCGNIYDIPLDNETIIRCNENEPLHVEQIHVYYKGLCHNCYSKKEKC